jgi:hypothetical protein
VAKIAKTPYAKVVEKIAECEKKIREIDALKEPDEIFRWSGQKEAYEQVKKWLEGEE